MTYVGVSGDADTAIGDLLAGTLSYNPNAVCNHHHGGHGHAGGHGCGEHGCKS